MEIKVLENLAINWETILSQTLNGTTGFVIAKTVEFPTFKIRKLNFSENYKADHWCEKGHIIYVLSGELIIEYSDKKEIIISEGDSLILGDNFLSHRAKTILEAQILIID